MTKTPLSILFIRAFIAGARKGERRLDICSRDRTRRASSVCEGVELQINIRSSLDIFPYFFQGESPLH